MRYIAKRYTANKYTVQLAQKDLPARGLSDNKTHGGKCLLIAGSKGLFGAAILGGRAASRSGAGYTYLKTSGKFPVVEYPDFLLLAGSPDFSVFQAVALGPGFLNRNKIQVYLKKMKKQNIRNVVLDAEALNVLADFRYKIPKSWVVTPHEGELARILKVPSRSIKKNRKKYLLIAQKKLGCIVLLKGHQTLVTDGQTVWEIQSGNPALAKAGTGDVLTGMILGFMSQGLDAFVSAKLAAYVHGMMADSWIASKRDVLSLMASDMVELIPKALYQLRKGRAFTI